MPKVLCAVKDIFFTAKILDAAKAAGVEVITADFGRDAIMKAEDESPGLVIIDLNEKSMEPIETAGKLAGKFRVIGFLSHVQTELRGQAEAVGCEAMPRSEFSAKLKGLLEGIGK